MTMTDGFMPDVLEQLQVAILLLPTQPGAYDQPAVHCVSASSKALVSCEALARRTIATAHEYSNPYMGCQVFSICRRLW